MNHGGTEITEAIIGAAIEVHRQLGPGMLESVYEAVLAYELAQRGLEVERQKAVPLVYKELSFDGLIINFKVPILKQGIKRLVN